MNGESNRMGQIRFPAGRHGWGWGLPVAWQGWVVLLLYAAINAAAWRFLPPQRDMRAFLILVGVATIALVAICWWKGERPRWRGGSH